MSETKAANVERAEYLKERGWKWMIVNPNPPVKPKPTKRKLYSDREHQLMRPTLRVYHS